MIIGSWYSCPDKYIRSRCNCSVFSIVNIHSHLNSPLFISNLFPFHFHFISISFFRFSFLRCKQSAVLQFFPPRPSQDLVDIPKMAMEHLQGMKQTLYSSSVINMHLHLLIYKCAITNRIKLILKQRHGHAVGLTYTFTNTQSDMI